MIRVIMPGLRFAFEIGLLAVIQIEGIRELSPLATFLILSRLFLSFITRMSQLPGFLDGFNTIASRVIICIFKIVLEARIFFSLKEDINISTNVVIIILILMSLRNISDTCSLLAIDLDE